MDDISQNVNVVTPEGEVASLPQNQLQDALNSGFTQASPEDLRSYDLQQKYGNQKLKTAAEGAAQSATFGLSTGIEKLLGTKPEDILGREEANPVSHGVGQAAGFLVPGSPEAQGLEALGKGASRALGLGAKTAEELAAGARQVGALNKIGSSAVKGAVETAALTGGDEVSKMLANDPDQSIQTAATNIGLSGILGGVTGGGLGSANQLWEATGGKQVNKLLNMVQRKSAGFDGVLPDEIADSMGKIGLSLPGETKALLSDNPYIKEAAQTLMEGGTLSATKAREGFEQLQTGLKDSLLGSVGRTMEDIESLPSRSENQIGGGLRDQLVKTFEDRAAPVTEAFDATTKKFSGVPLVDEEKAKLIQDISETAINNGYMASASSPRAKFVTQVIKDIEGVADLKGLKQLQTELGKQAYGNKTDFTLHDIMGTFSRKFRDFEDSVIDSKLANEAPEIKQKIRFAREQYKNLMNDAQDLADYIKPGAYHGINQFVDKLKDMDGEAFLKKLAVTNRADLLNVLKSKAPELLNGLKEHQVNSLLEKASKGSGYKDLNAKTLFKSIADLPPELREFAFSPDQLQKIEGIKKISDAIPERFNPSGTARTIDSLSKYMPNTAMGILSFLTGHGAGSSILLSALGSGVLKESKDAVKLGLLRFLSNGQHVSASGFKGMVEYIDHMIKGENLIGSSVKNLFKGASLVIPEKLVPDQSKRDRLDKKIESLKTNPEHLLNVGGTTTAYLPEHGNSIGQTAGAAVSYLQSVKPQGVKKAPLDVEPSIPKAETAQYNRTLDIAEQPLVILQHIKNGSLTVRDMVDLHSMYPALYNKLNSQISDQLSNAVHKGTEIPYKTKLSLSLFMGQPLDSTMTPSAIQNSQLAMTHAAVQQGLKEQKQKGSLQKLDKLAGADQTPQQSREARHLKS